MRHQAYLLSACVALLSCNDARGIDLERMTAQYRDESYGENPAFSDGRSMRTPPAGAVHREQVVELDPMHTGIESDRYLEQVPLPVDRALLLRGRDRFALFCAACHGSRADGHSQVAENMSLRRPPSFFEPPISQLPVGRIYSVISRGYGLMPAYAHQLAPRDRWAVVAYVDVLRLGHAESAGGPPSKI